MLASTLSEAQICLRIVRNGMTAVSGETPSPTDLATKTGIPRSTVYALLEDKHYKGSRHRTTLRKSAAQYLAMPWGLAGEAIRQDLMDLFEKDIPFHNDNAVERCRLELQGYMYEARTTWRSHVLDTSAPAQTRVLHGLLLIGLEAQLRNPAQNRKLGLILATGSSAGDIPPASDLNPVFAALDELMADDAVNQLYEGEMSYAKRQGLNWLRLRIWGQRLGLTLADLPAEEHPRFMETVCNSGYVEACNWAHDLTQGQDLTPVQNAWIATVLASRWQASVEQAEALFTTFPEYLHSRTEGMRAAMLDPDHWPGFAAILAFPDQPGLAPVRDWLLHASHHGAPPELEATVLKLRDMLRADPSLTYSYIRACIGDIS